MFTRSLLIDRKGTREVDRFAECQHPARIGAHFVIAAEHIILQYYLTVCLAFVQFHHLAVVDMPRLVEYLHIEGLAQERRLMALCHCHIRLEPDGIAYIIAAVVEVQICLLPRISIGKCYGTVEKLLESGFAAGKLSTKRQKEEQRKEKY